MLLIVIADDSNRDESKAGNNARKVAEKLVKYADLLAVMGHYTSDATKQALPFYEKAQVVLISATSTSANLKSPFFFRTIPSASISAQKIASYFFSQLQQPNFSVTGATGTIRFAGSDRQNGTISLIGIHHQCNSQNFVFTTSDRLVKCQ